MLRTLFVAVFLSIYILIVGPPLLGLDACHEEPQCDLLGGHEWRDVFRAAGWRARSCCWDRADPGRDLYFCGEPYEFGGCACGGRRDSAADCDFAEEVAVRVPDCRARRFCRLDSFR